MKFIHTSDWHFGVALYGRSLEISHRSFINQLAEIVRGEQPDALLISGDIFDVSQPSASVVRMFNESICRLREECPDMVIIATAGNHDSPSRHETHASLLRELGILNVGSVDAAGNYARNIIEIPGRGYVVALPYVSDNQRLIEAFNESLNIVTTSNVGELPVVVMMHTAISGCDAEGHDVVDGHTIGNIDTVSLSEFPEGYDYLALGHIHRAQSIYGSGGKARYSGSPVAVSFSEEYPHSVVVAQIESHGETTDVRLVEIVPSIPLVSLPSGKSDATWDELKAMLNELPESKPLALRLNVSVENFVSPLVSEEVLQMSQGKEWDVYCINPCRSKKTGESTTEPAMMSIEELTSITPIQLVERYAADRGYAFSETLRDMLNETVRRVSEEESDK